MKRRAFVYLVCLSLEAGGLQLPLIIICFVKTGKLKLSELKRLNCVAIGLTSGDIIVNKRTSSTKAAVTAQLFSFETTNSAATPPNSKIKRQ